MTCLPLTFFSLKGTGIPDRKKKLKKRSKQLWSYYFHFVLVCTRVYPLGRRHGVIKYRRAQWDISGLSFSRGVPPIWSPAGKTQTTRTHTAIGVADCAPVPPKWREASCWPCVCLCVEICVDICDPHVAGHRACHATSIFVPPCAGAVVSRDVFGRHTIEPRHHP